MAAWSSHSATTPFCPKARCDRAGHRGQEAGGRSQRNASMKITLMLDPDLAVKVKRCSAKPGRPLSETVKFAIGIGLDQMLHSSKGKPYRTIPRPMGLREGFSYDNIDELLTRSDSDDSHRDV